MFMSFRFGVRYWLEGLPWNGSIISWKTHRTHIWRWIKTQLHNMPDMKKCWPIVEPYMKISQIWWSHSCPTKVNSTAGNEALPVAAGTTATLPAVVESSQRDGCCTSWGENKSQFFFGFKYYNRGLQQGAAEHAEPKWLQNGDGVGFDVDLSPSTNFEWNYVRGNVTFPTISQNPFLNHGGFLQPWTHFMTYPADTKPGTISIIQLGRYVYVYDM